MEAAVVGVAGLETVGNGDSQYRKLDNIEEGVKPAGAGIEPTTTDSWRSELAQHFAVFVALLIWALCVGLGSVNTSKVFILERDPTISFPYVKAQVPVSMLAGISVGIPCAFVVLCATLVFRYNNSSNSNSYYVALAKTILYLLLTLAQCLLLADGITNTIKVLVLRPRPNFLAYCNYKGFQTASSSGNYTSYNLATQPNAVGSTSFCLSKSSLPDSVLSFPSGHSSLSFAGMTFISLLIKYSIEVWGQFQLLGLHGAIFVAPLFLSSWIAITRIQDYFHHEDDVMMGCFIGASASLFVFNAARPLLDGCGSGARKGKQRHTAKREMLSSEVQEGLKALRFKEQVVQAKSHLEELSARLRHVEDEEEAEAETAPVVWDWASAYQKFSQWEDVEELREQKKTEEERLKEIMERASDNMGHFHDHSEERKLFKLPEAEKMAFCEHHRLLGNALYREGHLHKAAEKYQLALSYYQYCFPDEEALQAQLDAVRLACLCNASLCMRRLGELRSAVDAANEALALDRACARALLRRAQALNDLDDFSSALQDLSEAQQLVAAMEGRDAGVGACVQRELVRLGRRRKKALESEQRLAQAMLQTQTPTEPLPPQGQEQGAKDVKASVWADVALPLEPSWPSFA